MTGDIAIVYPFMWPVMLGAATLYAVVVAFSVVKHVVGMIREWQQ